MKGEIYPVVVVVVRGRVDNGTMCRETKEVRGDGLSKRGRAGRPEVGEGVDEGEFGVVFS
jgi:hypothetical protein